MQPLDTTELNNQLFCLCLGFIKKTHTNNNVFSPTWKLQTETLEFLVWLVHSLNKQDTADTTAYNTSI